MKSTGIVRNLDNLGRIVIPKELRDAYNMPSGTPLEMFTDGDKIIMRKFNSSDSCILCGVEDEDKVYMHRRSKKWICTDCVSR